MSEFAGLGRAQKYEGVERPETQFASPNRCQRSSVAGVASARKTAWGSEFTTLGRGRDCRTTPASLLHAISWPPRPSGPYS